MANTMESINLNGKTFNRENVKDIYPHLKDLSEDFINDLVTFLEEWWNDASVINVKTSGSTGLPKTIQLSKNTVLQSAKKTLAFFNLAAKDNALLCLPVKYISGKLMLVRAIAGQLNLIAVEPDSNPIAKAPNVVFKFAAMVPMQVYNGINSPKSSEKLKHVENLLMGGGKIMPQLQEALKTFSNPVFLSFGMTETATHIALQQIGGTNPDQYFTALPGVKISLDERQCLVIEADHLPEKIITNDRIHLSNTNQFEWLGRWDNIINSGGIKHLPEQIEKQIENFLGEPFFIAGIPDEQLQQKVVLIVESEPWPAGKFETLIKNITPLLNRHQLPKDVLFSNAFRQTNTAKVDRIGTLRDLGY